MLSSELPTDLSFDSITCRFDSSSHRFFILSLYFVWDPVIVTAIPLAYRRGDGLFPGSPSDFISHLTGRLCVRNKFTLGEQGSLSLGARAHFTWSQAAPSTLFHLDI